MVKSAAASLNTIEAFLENVGSAEKRAAESNTEAGSIGGETEHPVKNVDDRTEPAKEGARSSENESDVKEDQGKVGVNSTPEATAKTAGLNFARFARPVGNLLKRAEEGTGGAVQTPGSAPDDQLQIGTNKQPTGEDPSVETGSAKAGKEDPGSDHPARTDNTSLDGHKYANDIAAYSKMPLDTLALHFEKTANELVAAIAVAPMPGQQQTQKQASAPAPAQPNVAHQAGWELAGLTSGQFDKQAADALVQDKLSQIIKTANDDADNVIAYYTEYANERQKLANDPMMDPAAAAGGGAGGTPPEGGPGADQAMLDALGGGGGGGGMPGGMGGDPAAAGGAGGAGGDEQGIQALLQACEELQLAPGELAQMLMADAGGAGGDAGAPAPGGAAGGPPPGGAGGGAGGPPPEGGGEEPGMEAQAGDKKGEKSAAAKGNTQKTAGDVLKELFLRSKPRR